MFDSVSSYGGPYLKQKKDFWLCCMGAAMMWCTYPLSECKLLVAEQQHPYQYMTRKKWPVLICTY